MGLVMQLYRLAYMLVCVLTQLNRGTGKTIGKSAQDF